jgi:hypothetical protein
MAVQEASRWIDENWKVLSEYNNQWIAASPNQVIANASSFEQLATILSDVTNPLDTLAIVFVTFDLLF